MVIEVPIFIWMARHYKVTFKSMFNKNAGAPFLESRSGIPILRGALAGAWGTCMTHPLLWFVWPRFYISILKFLEIRLNRIQVYNSGIMIAEILIALIESFTFWLVARKVPLSRAIAASFFANAASYGLGQLVRYLWPDLL